MNELLVQVIAASEIAQAMTSDRMIQAWQACADALEDFKTAQIAHMNRFYRQLYAMGIIDTPVSRHPMTARKMRGAIRRLKAGEIRVKLSRNA